MRRPLKEKEWSREVVYVPQRNPNCSLLCTDCALASFRSTPSASYDEHWFREALLTSGEHSTLCLRFAAVLTICRAHCRNYAKGKSVRQVLKKAGAPLVCGKVLEGLAPTRFREPYPFLAWNQIQAGRPHCLTEGSVRRCQSGCRC